MNYKKTSFYKSKNISNKKGQELVHEDSNSVSARKDSANNDSINTSFNDSNFSVFLNKKTEKLVTALYMVTSFLSDSEPLKWKLRENGVVLLSGITTTRNRNVSEMENVYISHSFIIEEIISFLEVGVTSKLISEMNFSILKKEYFSLKHLIESGEYMNEKSGKATFSDNFFNTKEDEIKEKDAFMLGNSDTSNPQLKNSIEGYKSNKGQTSRTEIVSTHTATKSRNLSDTGNSRTGQIHRTLKDIKSQKLNRRDTILKLFKTNKGKKLTIKDVSRHVSTCSEKTIQRELTSLVLVGVLDKEGERRWSKYALK